MNFQSEPYLTVKEINKVDHLASEKYGIPSLILMENAGRSVALETIKFLRLLNHSITNSLIAVFCGGGKNGGDGFVSARYLYNYGYKIKVYLLKNPAQISGDILTNFTILKKIRIKTKIVSPNILPNLSLELKSANCIIDAIFGTGAKGKIENIYAQVIRLINQTNKPIISVDIPSGLDANTGFPLPCTRAVQGLGEPRKDFSLRGECIKARVTVTMGYPKKGFLNPEAKKFLGKVVVADIGYPRDIVSLQNQFHQK